MVFYAQSTVRLYQGDVNEKHDVKFHMSSTAQNNNNDVNRKKKEHGIKPKETKRQSDLPLVAILHDSVLNGVQGKRLGRSHGFEMIRQKNWREKKKLIILIKQ